MNCWEVYLKPFTSKHHQIERRTEINCGVVNFQRCYCNYYQTKWIDLLRTGEYACNSATKSSMGMSPFRGSLGSWPASPLDIFGKSTEPTVQCVADFKTRLAFSVNEAKFPMKTAQAHQSTYDRGGYIPPHYAVGDEVFLSRENFTTATPKAKQSRRLGEKRYGSFKVLEPKGDSALCVQLPHSIMLHPVVNVEHIARIRRKPTDISNPHPTPPQSFMDKAEDLVMTVESKLAHRRRGRGLRFLTLYKETLHHEAEWRPLREFVHA